MHISPMSARPSRRTITTAAAWAVPVVAVGAAAPHAAASNTVIITFTGSGCKYPGQSVNGLEFGYRINFTVTSPIATTVTFASVIAPNYPDAQIVEVGPAPIAPGSKTTSIPAGTSQVFVIVAADLQVDNGNSANGTATFTYTTGNGEAGTVVGDVTGFKPCK